MRVARHSVGTSARQLRVPLIGQCGSLAGRCKADLPMEPDGRMWDEAVLRNGFVKCRLMPKAACLPARVWGVGARYQATYAGLWRMLPGRRTFFLFGQSKPKEKMMIYSHRASAMQNGVSW